jgi:hypothetical protein
LRALGFGAISAAQKLASWSKFSPNIGIFGSRLDRLPIQAPHYSIIGDRWRGDTPNSSDGVVPYWSSHLASAESEKIVSTGHEPMADPAAVAEIRRILLLNLGIRKMDLQREAITPNPADGIYWPRLGPQSFLRADARGGQEIEIQVRDREWSREINPTAALAPKYGYE